MKPLLVGEANPYGGPPGNALIPDPPHCAGWNLCHKILQLSESEYYERFDRVNLCHRDWKIKEARVRAGQLLHQHLGTWVHETSLAPQPKPKPIVLLGAKVCAAFSAPFEPFTIAKNRLLPLVILPHPSGLSRAWNEPGAHERARAVLREAGVL